MKHPGILVVTTTNDVTSDYVILALRERRIPYFRINTDTFPTTAQSTLRRTNRDGHAWDWSGPEGTCRVDRIRAIYYRRQRLPEFSSELDSGTKAFCARETSRFLQAGLLSLPAVKWMNHPRAVAAAEAKVYQLQLAANLGFHIPDTVTTNDPLVVRNFFAAHDGRVIAKPVRSGYIDYNTSQGNIFTSVVAETDLDDLSGLQLAPVTFQEHVCKQCDVRVTVIGTQVFATAIHSQVDPSAQTDWRATASDALPHTPYRLPDDVSRRCVDLTTQLDLSFGAIDLILTPDGDHVFLEINPSGQWAWLEEKTGDRISQAIASWLEEAAR